VPLYEPLIPARYLAPLLGALQALPAQLLQPALDAAGVDQASLQQVQRVIPLALFDNLLVILAEYSGRTDLGFTLGQTIKLEDHQALGVVLRRCRSADQLIRVLTRFSRLVSPSFNLQYRRSPLVGELVWRPAAYMSPLTLRALEEAFAVSTHVELRDMLGERLLPFDVYLSMQAPTHQARYAELRPTRFHFGCQALPEVKIVFPAELLELPLQATPNSLDQDSCATLEEQQRAIARTERWREWATLILREAEGCQPSREDLAALLNVSPATLTRRLAAEGCSLRELGRQIRQQRACAMLGEPRQSISTIAYRLGYSDVANFSHAFRSATGQSPRAYRNGHSTRLS
jgi:AraC-like DNA-binding protein